MRRLLVALAPALSLGCLPEDTRPPPAEVTVTVSSSPLSLEDSIPSVLTADGFEIHVERFIVALGSPALGGDVEPSCHQYSNPSYTRAFDFKAVDAPAELGIAFATGSCTFGFLVRSPNEHTLAGSGVGPEDLAFMRARADDHDARHAGVSLFIEGRAVRGELSYHFAWPFRKAVSYDTCLFTDGTGGLGHSLDLASGEHTNVNIVIHAEAFFLGETDGLYHFQPYADADADGDGEITFDELWGAQAFDGDGLYVSLVDPVTGGRTHPCFTRDGAPINVFSLGDYAYCVLLPNVARVEDNSTCGIGVGPQPDDP